MASVGPELPPDMRTDVEDTKKTSKTSKQLSVQNSRARDNDPCYELGQRSLRCSEQHPHDKWKHCSEHFYAWRRCFKDAQQAKRHGFSER